jgi:ABC-type thiamine transport system substrate-binding protein
MRFNIVPLRIVYTARAHQKIPRALGELFPEKPERGTVVPDDQLNSRGIELIVR